MGEPHSTSKPSAASPAGNKTEQPAVPEGKLRNTLIFGSVGLFAAIIFGLLYLFVIAPSVPEGGQGWSIGWFLFSFAAGLTMIVLPCTLPLAFVIVPLSMGKGLMKGLSMAVAFGIGVAVTLSLYGVAAALVGGLAIDALGADLEVLKNWVYFIAGIFALIFALSEIGLLNFHMPTYSGAAPAFIQKRQEVVKAFLLGLFLGNIGVGCPHPATPLILIEIATSGDVLYGWLMFLVHAIGRVLPLLLLAFLAILGVNGLNWLLSRKAVVERATGWAMVFVAGFILTLGLFSHDWWVNSGLHSGLEAVTQEAYFNRLLNDTLDQNVAHLHGLEEGQGLFGLPLEWGSWVLVALWLVPIWWWWMRRKKHLQTSPAFALRQIEDQIDKLEKQRRQMESIAKVDELDPTFDLKAHEAQMDELEHARRVALEKVQYGETGVYKDPTARGYEVRLLHMHRNYLIAISIFLALTFIYFIPENFYLKSTGGAAHDDEHAHSAQNLEGLHMMSDGTVMNSAGEVVPGAHMMPDGSFMLSDGTTVGGEEVSLGVAYSTEVRGLPEATEPETVVLSDGDTYDITAFYVQKEVGNRTLRMLSYNGSVPGPFIKATQGSEITINFTNNTDTDQTIHHHGIRIDNLSDGVPNQTQDVVQPGGSFTYTIKFEDGGVYWYHPHTRDDYGQEMGLYGNYLIDFNTGYPSTVNREIPLVIDDILIENDRISNFYKELTNFALLGRFGNEFLVNGQQNYTLTAKTGEVIRFFVTNVSNARTYNLSIPGAQMKLVGADVGKYEREFFADNFLISPAERMIAEAYFEEPGVYSVMHTMPGGEVELVRILVTGEAVPVSHAEDFRTLKTNQDVVNELADVRSYRNQSPDKRLLLTVQIQGMVDHSMHTGHAHDDTAQAAPAATDRMSKIQWNDPGMSDKTNTSHMITWKLVDQDTGKVSMDIPILDWTFKQGELVKIRLTNDANADHVMQHPIHMHGQRFVVLSENGVPNDNLVWKDTVLVFPGEVVEILAEMSNLGEWMSHCHISEHLHAGMMMSFRVEDENGYATGDEYRSTVQIEKAHGNMDQMENMPAMQQPASTESGADVTFDTQIPATHFRATPLDTTFSAYKKQELTISIQDVAGNSILPNGNVERPLQVTFVKSGTNEKVYTYPGTTAFDNYVAPHGGSEHDNSDGHHGFNWQFTRVAHADGDASHPHPPAGNVGYTYTMPVVFPGMGIYRAFVEFVPENQTEPVMLTFDVEVTEGFSVDNFGWSKSMKWWILLTISLVLMSLLSWIVYRYVIVKE